MEQIYLIKDTGMLGKMNFNFTYTFLLRLLAVPLTLFTIHGNTGGLFFRSAVLFGL